MVSALANDVQTQSTARRANKNKPLQNGTDTSMADQSLNKAAKRDNRINRALNRVFRNLGNGTLDLNGAPALFAGDSFDRAKVENAAYDSLTKNVTRDEDLALEKQKQELAARGIPYTPGDQTSGYQQAINGVSDKYDAIRADARNQATLIGGQELERQSNVQLNARKQFVDEALAKSGLPVDMIQKLMPLLSDKTTLDAILTKYGIDKDFASKKYATDKAASSSASTGSDTIVMGS